MVLYEPCIASVPTLAYFLAGQCSEGREVWENYLSTSKFIRYFNLLLGWKSDHCHRPFIDRSYLVYRVLRDRSPFGMAFTYEATGEPGAHNGRQREKEDTTQSKKAGPLLTLSSMA